MDQKNTKKQALESLNKPSGEQLSKYQRIGLTSGGLIMSVLGVRKFRSGGWLFTAVGGALAYLGLTGKNPLSVSNADNKPLKATANISVQQSRSTVYHFWRELKNLSQFMDHVKEVREVSDQRSKWKGNLNGVDIEWEAEITQDVENEKISWRSLLISDIQNNGTVTFKDTTDAKGTEISVEVEYAAEAGKFSKVFASVYQPIFEKQIRHDLEECRKILESERVFQTADNNV